MQNKTEIQSQMNRLTRQNGIACSPQVQSYFDHYGLNCPSCWHHFGWFQSRGLKLAGHLWNPPTAKAMVVVLHGYLNHTGQMKHLIAALVEAGFAVGAFDLPGHGLSEGKDAAVGAFGDYTMALMDFVLETQRMCPGPRHLAGFSTGSAVCIDGLLSARSEMFDKVALAGPLVRWQGYTMSRATYLLSRAFTSRIRRMPRKNSSDKNFLSFNRGEDYLHGQYVLLDWVRALYEWNHKIVQAEVSDKEILVLQGDRDTTVDWRYNLSLLREKFPAAKIQMIKGARHEVLNEALVLRNECVTKITHYFSSSYEEGGIYE